MKSRMKGDFHVRFRENVGVKFPCVTRLAVILKTEIIKMKMYFILIFIAFISCNNSTKQNPIEKSLTKTEMTKETDDLFQGNLVVILSEELKDDSNTITLQDYIENGKSFIPIFSTIDKFNESTKESVKNPKIEINGMFLLSLLKGNETLRLNPGLENEKYYNAEELLENYSEDIQKLKTKMETQFRK